MSLMMALASSPRPPLQAQTSGSRWWQSALGTLGAVFLGAVLLVAAWAKALDPTAFARQIAQEGLAILLPAAAVALFALGIEVFLGSALVLGLRRPWVLWPSVALVVFFLLLTGRTYYRFLQGESPADTGCGCFGNLVERTPAEAFWQDLLLLVPALALAFLGRVTPPQGTRWRLAAVSLLTVGALVFAWRAPDLPLDDLATRLRPGVAVKTLCIGQGEQRECLDGARILPELQTGAHWVVLADLADAAFTAQVEPLNAYHLAGQGPRLWVLTDASEEALFAFRFGHGPAFEVREAPTALLRPLYRQLPRSFRVQDGQVVETLNGLPPWASGPGTI